MVTCTTTTTTTNTNTNIITIDNCGCDGLVWFWFGLVWWVLWHINLCRLFNAKSIFM